MPPPDLLAEVRRYQQNAGRGVSQQQIRNAYAPPSPRPSLSTQRSDPNRFWTGFESQQPPDEPETIIYTVEVTRPDGSREELDIEGPDGLSEAQLMQYAQSQPQEPGRPLNPLAAWGREALGAIQGGAHVLDNAAELAQDTWNATGGRLFGQSNSATQANQQGGGFEGLSNQIPGAELPETGFGRAVGEIGTSAFLTRGLGGPLTQGAASGALMSEGDTWGERGRDAAIGGVTGYLGDRVLRGVAGMISPNVPQAVRELHARGVPMSPGQAIPPFRRGEERLMSRPFVGDQIVAQRQAGYEAFNRAALDEVVAPYNAVAPRPVNVPQQPGRSAIKSVGDQLSDRYETLIPNLRMVPDQQLATDITAVAQNLTNGNLSPQAARQFQTIVQNQVMPHLGSGPMNGESFRQIERRLGNQIRRYSRSTAPDDQAMAEAFEGMQDAFQGALARSNPRYAQELSALNTSWRNLVRVEGAASGARGGLFSPAQFRQAVRRGDMSTRGRGMARGEAPMQTLADAADEVLPSQYPDSGTSGRSQMNPFDPRYWLGAAQGLAYTPHVQQGIVNAAIGPRPFFAQPVADFLRSLPAPQAGAYGGDAFTSSLFGPVPR